MPPMRLQRGKTPRKRTRAASQVDPVEVYCRVRPLDNPGDEVCLKVMGSDTVQLESNENSAAFARTGQLKEIQYRFQHVFDEYASQKGVFDFVSLPLIEDLIHGKNGLLFTYGVTSSGKTYTMTGTPMDQGILPRCLDVLFNSIGDVQAKKYVFKPDKMNGFEVQTEADAMMERQKKDILPGLTPKTPGTPRNKDRYDFGRDSGRLVDPSRVEDVEEDTSYAVFVSYIEIYNNYVYDLLEELPYDPITGYKPPQSKILRTDSMDSMYVMNCQEVEIKSPEEAFEVLYKGQKRRKVAHTALNAESSRSHSIFNIRLVQAPLDPYGQEVLQELDKVCISQLSLVDLAGSERVQRTKNQGDRLKEAGNINQTLMALRACMESLRENQKNGANKMVPYRDSKLTHLFKNYFDGDGRVRMIVCVNPKAEEFDETVQVMKFAEMSQEVMVTRSQQVKFDLGLAPGRRRLGAQIRDAKQAEEASQPPPVACYSLERFPTLQYDNFGDKEPQLKLLSYLRERHAKRQSMLVDFDVRKAEFRSRLVEMTREYQRTKERNEELEAEMARRDSMSSKLESQCRSLEHKVMVLQSQLQDTERMRRDYEAKERERRRLEDQLGGELMAKDKKINMVRDILEGSETPRRFKTPAPRPTKSRTYTTPAVIQSAKSESDVSTIGVPTPTPRQRTNTGIPVSRPYTAGRSNASRTPVSTPKGIPQYNLRHRRSRSNGEVWLDHKPPGNLDLDTVLQPSLKKKRSVSKLETKDTKMVSKYMLTHQEQASDGEFQTKYYKGDVIPTAGGGANVVFNDVEIHKMAEAGNRKRRSSCPQPQDFEGEWTDTETRCAYAIEGHQRKKTRPSPESRV